MPSRELACRCGKVHMTVSDAPLLVVECQCESCRKASAQLAALPGGMRPVAGTAGGTHYLMYRKDRASITAGAENLVAYRLTDKSHTRRIVAGCCNTPLFAEFEGGHWLSMYAGLWPETVRPAATMRTMVSDMPPGQQVPDDIPSARKQSLGFVWALLSAWAAMGFRAPKIAVAEEKVWDVA